eukprot:6203726-Pleurochrysis_carterae.AAC.2
MDTTIGDNNRMTPLLSSRGSCRLACIMRLRLLYDEGPHVYLVGPVIQHSAFPTNARDHLYDQLASSLYVSVPPALPRCGHTRTLLPVGLVMLL